MSPEQINRIVVEHHVTTVDALLMHKFGLKLSCETVGKVRGMDLSHCPLHCAECTADLKAGAE